MNLDEIRELILLLDQTNISEIEVQRDNFKISLRKNPGGSAAFAEPVANERGSELANYNSAKMVEIMSPMVGTFYASPAPDAPAFAREGDHVKKGQTLCIVEAMKLMNEIKSECDGTILEIAVENAEAIEYDQLLFLIEKD